MTPHSHRQNGFALASAVFLLVIMFALGTFILSISSTQHVGQALDIEGERAYQAANAGSEWARYRIAATTACPGSTAWGASGTSLGFGSTTTLTPFVATVECRLLETTDVDGVSTSIFEIRVTACNRPGSAEPRCPGNAALMGYVERQLQGIIAM